VEKIMAIGEVRSFSRNEVVFAEGRYNAYEYFQLDGVSHRYNTDSEGMEVTTGIFQYERVITPHFTRTQNGHSIFTLQALTDCTFLQIPAGAFRELMDSDQRLLLLGRVIVEKEFIRGLTYEVLFRAATARDRLTHFREHYPGLENIIPHTVIASFLGITPVSFSRLRGDTNR
jgi:CRP-like cAMP-binding protein